MSDTSARDGFPNLRERAEAAVQERIKGGRGPSNLSAVEASRLIHELQVRQAELEVQNEDLRRAQETLRESEERFRSLADRSIDILYRTDLGGRITYVSPSVERLIGYTPEEFVGTPIQRYLPESEIPTFIQTLAKVSNGEDVVGLQGEVLQKDGSSVFVEVNAFPVVAGEKVVGTQGIVRNITGRRRREDALRESERRYKDLADLLPQVVFETDERGNLTFVNRRALEVFGYTKSDMDEGLNVFQVFAPEEREKAGRNFRKRLDGEVSRGNEYMLLRKNSSVFPALIYSSRIIRDGRPVGVRGVAIDITDRKRAEEKIHKLSQFLESIIDNANVWIDVLDEKAQVIIWNRAAEKISGYAREEVMGHGKIWEWLYPDEAYRRDIVAKAMAIIEEGNAVEDLETTIRRKDGQIRTISWHSRNLMDEKGTPIGSVALGRDMTERKRAEEKVLVYQQQLRSLASELVQAEERERRRIAVDLHDHIGQNLAVALLKVDALGTADASAGLLARPLADIRDLVDHTFRDVRSLTFDLSPPILYALGLDAAVEELARQVQERHKIRVAFQREGEESRRLDDDVKVLLFRSVYELLMNVVRHAQAQTARVSICRQDRDIRIEVCDDGVGFDTSRLDARDTRCGGFGLFSIGERLDLLDGEFRVVSEPGRGTRVVLVAPIQSGSNANEGG